MDKSKTHHKIINTGEYLLIIDNRKKIIAHLPINDFPILQGIDLLPQLAKENELNQYYKKANNKYKYTEEDIWRAFVMGKTNKLELEVNEKIILSQPKYPIAFNCEFIVMKKGQIVWIGKYIYY